MAQVHHAKAPNAQRGANLRPLSLYDVGASTACVLRRHGVTEIERASVLAWLERERRRFLVAMMVDGRIEPRDVGRLLRSLSEGWHQGSVAPLPGPARIAAEPLAGFRRFLAGPREGRVFAGMTWRGRRLRAAAAEEVDRGRIVTALILSPGPMAHRVTFDPAGYWLQRGGLFGRSDRTAPPLRPWRLATRLRHEMRRIAPFRPVGTMDSG
jgi:O-antigen biosynthesis protein